MAAAVVYLNVSTMKHYLSLALLTALLAAVPVSGQVPANKAQPVSAASPQLTLFDLDFPGGPPAALVAAIEKASGRPLNVIIPVEYSKHQLPPLKMRHVNVYDLFVALGQSEVFTSRRQYTASFRTGKERSSLTDDTIWDFYLTGASFGDAAPMPSVAQFYLLKPYVDTGLTVDDITTAIQTAWRMNPAREAPSLSFHKETGLLIAVGDPDQVAAINRVLQALDPLRKVAQPSATASDGKKN
ncbi:hypothetical protein DB347_15485 [Opitutaceae bacterium EW11]|nr:hypothetical protein DB347_15485 [Opitutaceae bacterium EW11]